MGAEGKRRMRVRVLLQPTHAQLLLESYLIETRNITEKNQEWGMCAAEEGEWCIVGGKKSQLT